MKLLAILSLGSAVVASVVLVFFVFISFAFQGESLRGAAIPAAQASLQYFALIVAFIPLVVAGYLAIRWLRGGQELSLKMAIMPLGLAVLAGFSSFFFFYAGERIGEPQRKKEFEDRLADKAKSLTDLRQAVLDGKASPCGLLAADAEATHEDFARCRDKIKSLTSLEDRFREWAHLCAGLFFRIEFPSQNQNKYPQNAEEETWLLSTILRDWLERTQSLNDDRALFELAGLTDSLYLNPGA